MPTAYRGYAINSMSLGLGYFLGLVYWLLSITWRTKIYFHEGIKPFNVFSKELPNSIICAHWHKDELSCARYGQLGKSATMASLSKDGSIIAGALIFLGLKVARGSSSRDGKKASYHLQELCSESSYVVGLAVDGPRGPYFKAKSGIYYISLNSRSASMQCIPDCDNAWDFAKSNNKTYLPKPFSRVDYHLFPLPQATSGNKLEFLDAVDSRLEIPKHELKGYTIREVKRLGEVGLSSLGASRTSGRKALSAEQESR
ncbi:MAG: DUF374 domain-containing protein [Elusimicrobiota bacterium]